MSFPVTRDRAAAENLHARWSLVPLRCVPPGQVRGPVPRTCPLAAGDEGEEEEPEREQQRHQPPVEEHAPDPVADPVETAVHHLIRRHVACFDVKTA